MRELRGVARREGGDGLSLLPVLQASARGPGEPGVQLLRAGAPRDFVKARESLFQRVSDVSTGHASEEEIKELEKESDDAMRRALRSLLDLKDRT